jgi:phosphatidylglycerol:prolipoprotein diacylglycerol transferase
MLPFLELGPWRISTYYLIDVPVLTFAGTWAFYRLLRLNRPAGVVALGLFLTIVGGFAGTALTTYLVNWQRVASSGLLARRETLSISRAVICGIAVAAVYCWRHKVSLGRALDLVALPVLLGLAIARLGCFAAGCCYGRPTDSWLGVYLPDVNGMWAVRYPTQLMCAAVNLLIFLTLVAVERYGVRRLALASTSLTGGLAGGDKGWPFDGFLALLGIALYSLKRFAIAFLREGGVVPILGPLSLMHLEALAGLTIATALTFINLYRKNKEAT